MSWSWLVAVAESNLATLGDFALGALDDFLHFVMECDPKLTYEILIVFVFWLLVPLAIGACLVDCQRRRGVPKVRGDD